MSTETSPKTGERSGAPSPRRADPQALRRFVADAMMAVGMPADDAGEVAGLMVEADLAGADAHGVFRTAQYVERIRAGGMNPRAEIRIEKTAPATALVHGDNGMGHLVMAKATRTAIELARECGIGWVSTHHSNHAGAAGIYAEMVARAGMVGIYSAMASANHMAVWGATEMLLGTNPLALSVPRGDNPPIVLDIATTAVSYGTVKNHALQGRAMPEGWMVNRKDGSPITDPTKAGDGMLLPMGGYKGSGLALILGLLAGPMGGAVFGRDVVDFNADDSTPTNTGQFIMALDISRFRKPEDFHAEVARHLEDLRNSERLPGSPPIRLPGDQRAMRQADRAANGIPVPDGLLKRLNDIASNLSIAPVELKS